MAVDVAFEVRRRSQQALADRVRNQMGPHAVAEDVTTVPEALVARRDHRPAFATRAVGFASTSTLFSAASPARRPTRQAAERPLEASRRA